MAKISNKGILIIAGVISVVAALLAYNFLNTDVQKPPVTKEDATAVVAKAEILPNTVITADMVEQIDIPSEFQQPGAITDINRVVGVHAKERIMAREQISERLVFAEGKVAGFSGIIPPDKRAISIAVNDTTGVAGLLRPGDYVDVIVALDNKEGENSEAFANMTIQNALVLAANKMTNRGEQGGSTGKDDLKIATITLAVTSDEATQLALAVAKGQITLALRPFSPTDNGLTLVAVKTLDSLRDGMPARYAHTPAPIPAPVQVVAQAPQPISSEPQAVNAVVWNKTIPVIRGTQVDNVAVR